MDNQEIQTNLRFTGEPISKRIKQEGGKTDNIPKTFVKNVNKIEATTPTCFVFKPETDKTLLC